MKRQLKQQIEDSMWKRWNALSVVQGSKVIAVVKPSENGGGPYVFGKVLQVGKTIIDVLIEKSSWVGFQPGDRIKVKRTHVQLQVKHGSHPILADEKDILMQEILQGNINKQPTLF